MLVRMIGDHVAAGFGPGSTLVNYTDGHVYDTSELLGSAFVMRGWAEQVEIIEQVHTIVQPAGTEALKRAQAEIDDAARVDDEARAVLADEARKIAEVAVKEALADAAAREAGTLSASVVTAGASLASTAPKEQTGRTGKRAFKAAGSAGDTPAVAGAAAASE